MEDSRGLNTNTPLFHHSIPPLLLRLRPDHRLALLQAVRFGDEPDVSGLTRLGPNNHEREAVVSISLRRLEGFKARRVAVVGRHDLARTFDAELDVVLRARHLAVLLVLHGHGDRKSVV